MKKIKSWDNVIVIAGKDNGKISQVVEVNGEKAIVKGVHMVKKAVKGEGFKEFEKPIHISNIMHYDADAKTKSRVVIVEEKGKKVRKLVKTWKTLSA